MPVLQIQGFNVRGRDIQRKSEGDDASGGGPRDQVEVLADPRPGIRLNGFQIRSRGDSVNAASMEGEDAEWDWVLRRR